MSALKTCVCGDPDEPRRRRDDHGRYSFIECRSCKRATIHCRTPEEAIEAWNDNRGFE